MKPGKLYIKIFLSFVLILFITEILVFGLFLFSAGRHFRYKFDHYTGAKSLIAKELLEEKIRSRPETKPADNDSLKDFIVHLGEIYGAKVWLDTPDGTLILKSFSGDIPPKITGISKRHVMDFGSYKIYRGHKTNWESYISLPAEIGKGEIGTFHLLFEKIQRTHPEKGFAFGLVAIALVIALLTIPVSRMITKRVRGLTESSLRIAEGDLSHRVTVKGKDEIGELGRSFNSMADKLERMIQGGRELTANISHELRSPLARIRIAEELLREKLERGHCDNYERHLDDIREDIEELDLLIGRILILSKMDIQKTHLTFEHLDPTDLITELLERLKPAIDRRKLNLKTDLSCDIPFYGDKETLRTALLNILENAVKFTPEEGNVTVTMHSEQESLKISVVSTFEALSEEDLSNIFEPFYRSEQSREPGSGLGLAITKRVIEKHGGNIKAINSAEGLEIQIDLSANPSAKTAS
jgi:two-component system sensor histidine kinase CpxA